jgi:hypothetical protein
MDQTDQSILFRPAAIATLANEKALFDIRLFCKSLQVWSESPPPIYLLCSTEVANQVKQTNLDYTGRIYTQIGLDAYASLTREDMESKPSRKGLSNLFHDFTQEKCGLMEWALGSLSTDEQPRGVLFCDADIFWLGPLPLLPKGPTLALSQHMIRKEDEAKYGEYNAGFLWTNDTTMPAAWKSACRSSRFFEQAALEDLADALPEEKLYLFPIQCNYGWWRMMQSDQSAQQQQSEWTLAKQPSQQNSGIYVRGQPLVCIHTHLVTNDLSTRNFNIFIKKQLEVCKNRNPKAFILYRLIIDS